MPASRFKDWLLFTIGSCVLYLAGIFFPVPAAPVTLIFSLPTAYLAFRHGILFAVTSAIFSYFIIGFAFFAELSLLYLVSFGISGAVIGLMVKSKLEGGSLLVASATAECFGKLGGILLIYLFFGLNFLSLDAAEIKNFIIAFGSPQITAQTADIIIDRVILLVPYAIILFSVVEAFVCLLLISRIHRKRTGEVVFRLPPFNSWRFPKNILFALAVGFLCELISSSAGRNAYLMRQMGVNLSELSKTIFVLQGLSCAYFFMERRRIPKPMRIITVVMTPVIPFLGNIFAILGVADIGFDFRERKNNTNKEGGTR